MTWHDEMIGWLAQPEPDEAIQDQLMDLALKHRITWAQAQRGIRALASGEIADVLILLMGARFTEQQLETMPGALAEGASPWELLALHVHGRNCEGQDLPLLSPDELRERLQVAARLGQENPSSWLQTYTGLLLDEHDRRDRRRNGNGARR